MKKGLFAAIALSAGMLLAAPSVAFAQEIVIDGSQTDTQFTVNQDEDNTIVVKGDVVLNGTGDAFTINADTSLVFEQGATLTLTGYDNAFVVENATLSGGGWNITDGDGMDLFRLKTSGSLDVSSSVVLSGHGKTDTTSRAIVLGGNGAENQAISLASGTTLKASNFYRGVETGGAKNYTINGVDMNQSTFDFSDNDCGIALSYFDQNAHFQKCKLEVSNCLTSGIFMRQDNASLNGLYLDEVYINCVNASNLDQNDIAIRFHTVNFEIKDSYINIHNAWNTGLWICDGWDGGTKSIIDSTISVNNVFNKGAALYGPVMRRKAITLVPFGDWTINGCQIAMNGTDVNPLEGGLNIAADIKYDRNTLTAHPTYTGGKITLKDTSITTSNILGADIGVQVGQFLEIGEDVVIDNGGANDHFTVLCDDPDNGYPLAITIGSFQTKIMLDYDLEGLPAEAQASKRLTVTGGSYWSTRDTDLSFVNFDDLKFYDESVPINQFGDELTMIPLSDEKYDAALQENDALLLTSKSGSSSYSYKANNTTDDFVHYIWAPAYQVSFVGNDGSTTTAMVPAGWAFGDACDLPDGSWSFVNSDGEEQPFTSETVVNADLTVSAD